eukprot:CAMPEP_0174853598 /NCGR_PEP_ID=MMETSP1114-20130205/29056_1 /TAXON_ID=312471 /ORGANISM="Neobodo designis, Strain CCAP 1951/1" /LENGTH=593 /DNA_ID=CAMNT_0016088253 /DNA_START=21 /DNA_END=1799 /DNA_ORIENTATION=+
MNSADDEACRLRRVFERFDRDRSGTIDLSELRSVMHSMGVRISDAQLNSLVQQGSGSGTELDCREFIQLMKIWREAAKLKLFDDDGVSASDSRAKMDDALKTKTVRSDSWGRCVFDGVVAFTAFVFYVVVLLDDTTDAVSPFSVALQSVAAVVFATDICVSALTFSTVDSVEGSLWPYVRSWGAVDTVCAVPWGLIVGGGAGTALKHLPFFKLLKVPSLWRSSGRMPMSRLYISFHFKILPIILLALLFAIMVHGFAVGFVLVKQQSGTDPRIVDGRYPYTAAVYFVIYTLGTVGFGNIDILTPTEKLYACFVLCGSILVNGFIVGKLVAIMQAADLQKDRTGKLRQTLAVLEHFELPHALQDEVLQFQDHLLGNALGAHHADTLTGLPPDMHANIGVVVKAKLLACAPMFAQCHSVVQVGVAQVLQNDVRVPEQFILSIGEPVTSMYFIAHGFVDVFKERGTRLKTLSTNRHFGDGMLTDGVVSTVAVKSLGYCNLWSLSRADTLELAKTFRVIRELLANPPQGDGLFRRAPASTGAARAPQRAVVSLAEGADVLDGDTHGGELEEADRAQAVTRSERLRALSARVQAAHRR